MPIVIKRPFLWVSGVLCLAFLLLRLCCGSQMDRRYYVLEPYLEGSYDAVLNGTLDYIEPKTNTSYLYLKNASIRLKKESKIFYFSDFLVILQNKSQDFPVSGNSIMASGKIASFNSPSNPGQFDEKAYYKEKNIFYQMRASSISVTGDKTNRIKQSLYDLRDRIKGVYETCMRQKEAGLVSAMILGDKTILDADMKSLYQVSGIGHILAISGLHITIFCTLCYKLLSLLCLPKPLPFLMAVILLAGYGAMTGFGISTSRAVIMMVLGLLAAEIGRSYEPFTAMAVSAVYILLQKPYALFSCSFLLSYSAVLGVFLTYPALRAFLPESFLRRMEEKGRRGQTSILKKYILSLWEKLISSLLLSISIQLTSLPVLLYFFYEIPTYGVILNLLILPLVSIIVLCSVFGGLLGLLFLPLAKFPLFCVSGILSFYEWVCHLFQKLPEPVQIFGRPSPVQIAFYYLILAVWLWMGHIRRQRVEFADVIQYQEDNTFLDKLFCLKVNYLGVFFALLILLYRRPVSGVQITMLDVGQGDGILLQMENGRTVLIDGGSTDVSKAGTYRIMPFLKYYGIRRIDYMIMSHSDEDHISGQRELLENRRSGIKTGCYVMPYLPEESRDENYQKIQKTAEDAKVPVRYLNTGDSIRIGKANLICLHPSQDFKNDSANACSATLSLSYGEFRMLLTGDLEKEGEEAVTKRLEEKAEQEYTILKIAHHGSKNSTGEAFLSVVRPKVSLISCGKENRYGHPHQELLKRLEDTGSMVYRTDRSGAVQIVSDGERFVIRCYLVQRKLIP